MQQFASQAPPQVQSTLAKLELCRTAALGGHRYRCVSCDHQCSVHNSCGDRHCPLCAGAKRADWLDSTTELLLPGITYLCDLEELQFEFRTNFIAGLKRLHKKGKLQLKGEWSFLKS